MFTSSPVHVHSLSPGLTNKLQANLENCGSHYGEYEEGRTGP